MSYMRCSVWLVKGLLLQCIINVCFTIHCEMSAQNNPKFDRFTFPKHRYFKLYFDFSLRLGEQFGLILSL